MINYGYFRHRFDAHNNPKLNELMDKLGVSAYAYYYILIELYGVRYAAKSDSGAVNIHARTLSNAWRKRIDRCRIVLHDMEQSGLIVLHDKELSSPLAMHDKELSCSIVLHDKKNTFSISIPNFSKYYGSYKKTTLSTLPNKRKEKKRKEKESKVNEIKAPNISSSEILRTEIKDHWNTAASNSNLKKCKVLSDKRKKQIAKTILTYPEMATANDWERYFKKITESSFLCGGGNTGWIADFDWAIKPDNIIKVVEGKYESIAPLSRSEEILNMENPYA